MEDIFGYFAAERQRHLAELCEFLSIPSISTVASHADEVRRAAQWVADQLKQTGMADVELQETGGHPVVTAQTKPDPNKPTVLLYGHCDVQPPEPIDLWHSPPFSPTVRGDRLFARGAADDKGQVFIHLKVLEAFERVRGALPLNIKVLVEGEEEIGSPNLVPFLRSRAAQLSCDVVVVSDTHMQGLDQPSITIGLRGLACLQITVRTAQQDLHSGLYGGAVANPIQVLGELLVACKSPKTGRVAIPGFYDDVERLSPAVRRSLEALPHDDAALARAVGAPVLFGERGFSTPERMGARPTFEVNGIWGGYAGEGVKTVLPCEAHAKVSMRLVPNQDPVAVAHALSEYIKEIAPPHALVTVKKLRDAAFPTLVDPNFPQMRYATQAVREVFGLQPCYKLEGGSIPVVAEFARVLRRKAILLGFGLPDDNLHAPNEKFDLRMFDRGLKTVARFYDIWGASAARV